MVQIKIQKQDLINLINLVHVGLGKKEVIGKINHGILYVKEAQRDEIFVNARILIESEINDKFVKIEYVPIKEIKKSKKDVILNLIESEPKPDFTPPKLDFVNLNWITLPAEDVRDFINACSLMSCRYVKITDRLLVGFDLYGHRVIKPFNVYKTLSLKPIEVGMEVRHLFVIYDLLKELNWNESVSIYYAKDQPVFFDVDTDKSSFDVYIKSETPYQIEPYI
jgi:hypothetical protein